MSEQCKGFWNMCRCQACRDRDRKLSDATPDERREAAAEFLSERGLNVVSDTLNRTRTR